MTNPQEVNWPRVADLIYADCPWRYLFSNSKSRDIENAHPTMTLDDIAAIPVGALAAKRAALYLWVPATKVPEGLHVLKAWGFEYKTNIDWDKLRVGRGYYSRGRHEHLFIGARGGWKPPAPSLRESSIIAAPRPAKYTGGKPLEVVHLLDRQYPSARKVELFATALVDPEQHSAYMGWERLGFDTGWKLGVYGARRRLL